MLWSSEAFSKRVREITRIRFGLRIERCLFARHCSDPFTFIISCSSHRDPMECVSRMFLILQMSKLRLER